MSQPDTLKRLLSSELIARTPKYPTKPSPTGPVENLASCNHLHPSSVELFVDSALNCSMAHAQHDVFLKSCNATASNFESQVLGLHHAVWCESFTCANSSESLYQHGTSFEWGRVHFRGLHDSLLLFVGHLTDHGMDIDFGNVSWAFNRADDSDQGIGSNATQQSKNSTSQMIEDKCQKWRTRETIEVGTSFLF